MRAFVPAALVTSLLIPFPGDQMRPLLPLGSPVPSADTINPDDWVSLASAVEDRSATYRGHAAYIIKDFKSGHVASRNEDDVFPSASLIKVPIMCAVFQAVQDRQLSLFTPIALKRADRRGGSGVLKFASNGTVFTNRELVEAMIIHSDNTATNLLVEQLGIDYLQDAFRRLGLRDTRISADGFRLTSRQVEEDNVTSPRDMAYLLEKIYQRQLVNAEASAQMLDILKHQKLRDRLPRHMPQGWVIAHKTGLLRKACHDIGIVFSPKGDYLVCVLTSKDRTYKSAKQYIAAIGRITYDYYGNDFKPRTLHSKRLVRSDSRPS